MVVVYSVQGRHGLLQELPRLRFGGWDRKKTCTATPPNLCTTSLADFRSGRNEAPDNGGKESLRHSVPRLLTKWPLVFPVPDQKATRIVQLVAEEVVPMFGVPEALLSDRGTNLLANVIMDVCSLLGITKLNTTAYHPQCNGMVERMNRILKAMLRKHAVKFGPQWDKFLPGVLWAYRNTPHEATKEKPSFLMFGLDLRTPTEAALLPASPLEPTDVEDYREELILSLSSAR